MIELKDLNLSFYTYKLKEKSQQLWSGLMQDLMLEKNEQGQPYSLLQLVGLARAEWLEAKRFFEEVTEPELIDQAIFRLQAAERKYMYLLKISAQEGLVNNKIEIKH